MLAVFLAACRFAGIMLLSPVLGFAGVPALARVMFVLLFSLVVAAPAAGPIPSGGIGVGQLTLLAAAAGLQGALIGAALRAAVAAFGFGGQLLDFQIGYSAAAILNPSTELQSSLISTLLEMFGATLFVVLDFHHDLIRGLAENFQALPLLTSGDDLIGDVIAQTGELFIYGLALVMPVVVGLFLVDATVAVLSRSMPQINIYFVALPFKAFAGLSLLMLSLSYMGPLSRHIFGAVLHGGAGG